MRWVHSPYTFKARWIFTYVYIFVTTTQITGRGFFETLIRFPCAPSIPPEVTIILNSYTTNKFCMKSFWRSGMMWFTHPRLSRREVPGGPRSDGSALTDAREPAPPEGGRPHVGGAEARHNSRPRPPTPASPQPPHHSSRRPSRATGSHWTIFKGQWW